MAVCKTYSNGERDLGRFSGRGEGDISRLVRPIWPRSCFRRGEAEASIVRLERRRSSKGVFNGRGARRGGGGRGLGLASMGIDDVSADDIS